MKEHWLEILEWIQLAITFLFLLVMVIIGGLVLRNHRLEFNGLWKTRMLMVVVAILWALSLLLGRQQIWQPTTGLISVDDHRYTGLCRAYVFLTFGIWQPLFFLLVLMILRSKEMSKLQLYADDPNKYIIYRALLWCVPIAVNRAMTVSDIVILALSAVNESNPIVWATYSTKHHLCVVPIISTAASAAFYASFVLFYSNYFRSLRQRIRWTQLFFIFIFPLEIVVRFILIFIAKYEKPYEALYHTFFFLDLIVCLVAVFSFVLLPVVDSLSSPLMTGVTAAACKDYEKEEEARKKRRYTKSLPAMQRLVSDSSLDAPYKAPDSTKPSPTKPPDTPYKPPEPTSPEKEAVKETKHKRTHTVGFVDLPPAKGEQLEKQPIVKSTDDTPSPSSSEASINPSMMQGSIEMTETSLHATLTALTTNYPTDLDDIFANIDDNEELAEDSSLKLRVDGVFLGDHDS